MFKSSLHEAISFLEKLKLNANVEIVVSKANKTSRNNICTVAAFSCPDCCTSEAEMFKVPDDMIQTVSLHVSITAKFLGAGFKKLRSAAERMRDVEQVVQQLIAADRESIYWGGADGKPRMPWEVAEARDLRGDVCDMLLPASADAVRMFKSVLSR